MEGNPDGLLPSKLGDKKDTENKSSKPISQHLPFPLLLVAFEQLELISSRLFCLRASLGAAVSSDRFSTAICCPLGGCLASVMTAQDSCYTLGNSFEPMSVTTAPKLPADASHLHRETQGKMICCTSSLLSPGLSEPSLPLPSDLVHNTTQAGLCGLKA